MWNQWIKTSSVFGVNWIWWLVSFLFKLKVFKECDIYIILFENREMEGGTNNCPLKASGTNKPHGCHCDLLVLLMMKETVLEYINGNHQRWFKLRGDLAVWELRMHTEKSFQSWTCNECPAKKKK